MNNCFICEDSCTCTEEDISNLDMLNQDCGKSYCRNCYNDIPVQHPKLSNATYCVSCGYTHIPEYLLERPDDLPYLSDKVYKSVKYDDDLPF